MTRRRDFLAYVLEQMHTYYRWGGKTPEKGLDCSGLVTWALWKSGGPDWRSTWNTDAMWARLPEPKVVLPGDICLYGHSVHGQGVDANHVMVVVSDFGDADFLVVGAAGGTSDTTSQLAAMRDGAKVKVRQSHNYRADFLGFRALPLDDSP